MHTLHCQGSVLRLGPERLQGHPRPMTRLQRATLVRALGPLALDDPTRPVARTGCDVRTGQAFPALRSECVAHTRLGPIIELRAFAQVYI